MKVRNVPLEEINVGERFRVDLGNVEELAESIKAKGLIQPITVDENLALIAGGRRFAACCILGLEKIPAVIRKVADEIDARELELFENIHRKELAWQERVQLTARIHALMREKHGEDWGVRKTAALVDASKSSVSNAVEMAQAMAAIPELADAKTEDKARRKLKRLAEDAAIQQALKEAKAGGKQAVFVYAENHFIIGDAIDGLKHLHPNTRHFAEVDPPYAIELKKYRKSDDEHMGNYTEIPAREYPAFIKSVAEALFPTLVDNAFCIWWFGPEWYHCVSGVLKAVGFEIDDIPAIWYKTDTGTISGNPDTYLARDYEPFFVCRKGRPAIRQRNHGNVFPFKGVPVQSRIHGTERPLELMQDILRTFAYPKASIIVPFLGSGNTLVAAYTEGMSGMGWDLSEEHKKGFLTRVHKQFDKGADDV